MEYQVNRGKICSTIGCNNRARVKGLCMICYGQKKIKTNKNANH
jgi:hypothetical protein